MRLLFLLLIALRAYADEGNLKGLTVTADVNLVSNGQVNLTGLTAGSGGSILCIDANRVYVGGCTPSLPGYVTTSTAVSGQIPVYTTPTNIGPSSLTDNGTTVGTSEALTVTNNISGTNYYIGSTQIITSSFNIGNIVNIVASGQITFSGLTSGSGGTPVCVNASVLYSGGCGGTYSGTGTANTLTKWTGASSFGNSSISDNGTTITTSEAFTDTNNISGGSYYIGATQIITSGLSIGNIVNIVNSGTTTTTGNVAGGSFSIGGTGVIDSSRDIINIQNLTASGTVTFAGLTAGSGATAVCINASVLYVGGCGTAYSGSGTANVLTKWTGASSFGNSSITDNGTTITTSEALTVTNNISGSNYYVGSTQIITSGLNLGNLINGVFSGSLTSKSINTQVYAGAYNFPAYFCTGSGPIACSPGGSSTSSIAAGSNTVTVAPVPGGMNGSNVSYAVYFSGGSGSPESCSVTGGTAVSGSPSGTLIFTCAHTHTGAFSIQSSTSGVREAVIDAPTGSTIYMPNGTVAMDNMVVDRQVSLVGQSNGGTTLVPLTGVGTYLLKIDPTSLQYGMEYSGFNVNLTGFPGLSGVNVQNQVSVHVHDITIQAGTNGMVVSGATPGFPSVVYSTFENLKIRDQSAVGFLIDGDSSWENYFIGSDIQSDTPGDGPSIGFELTRGNNTYVGAFYLSKMHVTNVGGNLNHGFVFTGPVPVHVDIFMDQCVADGIVGDALQLVNMGGFQIVNSWIASTGSASTGAAVLIDGGVGLFSFTGGNRFFSQNGPGFKYLNSPTGIFIDDNMFVEIGTYVHLLPGAPNNPTNLTWGNNMTLTYPISNIPDLVFSAAYYYRSSSGISIWTNPASTGPDALDLYDPIHNIHTTVRNNTGTIDILGALTVSGAVQGTVLNAVAPFTELILDDTAATVTTGGLVRIAGNGSGTYQYQVNTASAGDFSSATNAFSVASTGKATFFQDLTASANVNIAGILSVGSPGGAGNININTSFGSYNWNDPLGTVTGGALWRFTTAGAGNELTLQMNTAVAGNFSTVGVPLVFLANGNAGTNLFTPLYNWDVNGSGHYSGVLSYANDLPDIEQYGCTSGMSDATACMNAAIAVNAAIRIPLGTWNVGTGGGNLTLHSNLLVVGDGAGTIIQRSGTIGANLGLFDMANLSNVRVANMLIDGAVTTPATQDYVTITDPLQANLTLNSTFWLHGGTNITLDHLAIQHTGGYAVLIDATANNVNGVQVTDSVLQNNRPFLFGTGSDLTYGSWTGGIFWDSDGSSHNIQNLAITGNTFKWSTGNAVWGHAVALTLLNKNITVSGNLFQDIGLDGIGAGPVDSYTVSANNFLRIGYPSITDNTTGTAKWFNACPGGTLIGGPGGTCSPSNTFASIPAVAIDSTGLVLNFTITGNTAVAHNGGCIDLDGAGYGSVAGNQCYIPSSGDPEYSDAQPSNWGPAVGPFIATAGLNYMYGVNTGNTNNTPQGAGFITITSNSLIGQGGGAIRLYAAKSNQAQSNLIFTASTTFYNPITIGGRTGSNNAACANEVSNNRITFLGGSGIPAVFEDAQYVAFQSGCSNKVHDNTIFGNLTAFHKDVNSSSINYGASTTLVGACSGSSACTTISSYGISNSQYGNATVGTITNQVELASGNYLDRWYSPTGDLMLTSSTDGSLRIGDGTIGSLWLGGNLESDVTRNTYLNSVSIGTFGSSPFLAISSNGTIAASTGGSGYFLGSTQIITPAGNIGNIGNIIGSGNQQMNGNVAANSFYVYNPSGPGSAQIIAPYTAGSVACTPTAPCGNIGNVLNIIALGTITASTEVDTPSLVIGGNVVFRCVTAGASVTGLPVGALTINSASCGSVAPVGVNVP